MDIWQQTIFCWTIGDLFNRFMAMNGRRDSFFWYPSLIRWSPGVLGWRWLTVDLESRIYSTQTNKQVTRCPTGDKNSQCANCDILSKSSHIVSMCKLPFNHHKINLLHDTSNFHPGPRHHRPSERAPHALVPKQQSGEPILEAPDAWCLQRTEDITIFLERQIMMFTKSHGFAMLTTG